MQVEEINSKWLKKLEETLNAGKAAIIFGFGMTRDKKVVMWCTKDIGPDELVKELRKAADVIEDALK